MGSWQSSYRADIGLFRDLEKAEISGSNVSKGELNGYVQWRTTTRYKPNATIRKTSGSLSITQVQQGQSVNLFGFALKQNGVFTHKYAVCRAYASVITTTPGNINTGYDIKWWIYNELTQTYSQITGYPVDSFAGAMGSITLNSRQCYCCFYIAKETWWGRNQTMIYGGLYQYSNDTNYGSSEWVASLGLQGIGAIQHLSQYDEVAPEEVVFSPEFGKSGKKKGGYNPDHSRKGTFDDSSDKIVVSSKPYDSPFRTGFINCYYMNPTNLAKLSDALFPEPGIYTNDIPQMIFNLYTTLWNSKRIDYILDLLIVPVLPTYLTETHVNCGGRPLARFTSQDPSIVDYVDGNPVEDAFVDKDCGTLTIPEYWANFLDFSGTRVKLFLPYVGYVDIEPEFIIAGQLHVWYRFNVFDGSFMCFVESTSGHSELEESLIGQYAGVAAIHIPLQSQDYSNKISGLISAIGTVGVGLAGGGMSASAGLGATASLVNTVTQKPSGTHANGYNASSSYMSHRTPYLIIERQSSQFSEKYPEEVGLPLYVKAVINDCHGLTVCENPHLDTIPATVEEKERIYKYLTEGIIV